MGELDENAKLTDCYFDKKDWRACTAEVSSLLFLEQHVVSHFCTMPILCRTSWIDGVRGQMARFKACWKANNNDQRTESKDASSPATR